MGYWGVLTDDGAMGVYRRLFRRLLDGDICCRHVRRGGTGGSWAGMKSPDRSGPWGLFGGKLPWPSTLFPVLAGGCSFAGGFDAA